MSPKYNCDVIDWSNLRNTAKSLLSNQKYVYNVKISPYYNCIGI